MLTYDAPFRVRKQNAMHALLLASAVDRRQRSHDFGAQLASARPAIHGTAGAEMRSATETSLFAALDIDGQSYWRFRRGHRRQQFLRFLRPTNAEVSAKLAVHLVLDNRVNAQASERPTVARAHLRFV